jgi:hypothetical protein
MTTDSNYVTRSIGQVLNLPERLRAEIKAAKSQGNLVRAAELQDTLDELRFETRAS